MAIRDHHLQDARNTAGTVLGGGVIAAALGLLLASFLTVQPAESSTPAAPQQLMWKADEIAAFERDTGGWPGALNRLHQRLAG